MGLIPVCIGMPRSASRMTWQIAKLFSPPEPPNWQFEMKRGNSVPSLRPEPWPYRSHDFVPGIDPVIYTYRDPVEAFLSLYSRLEKDEQPDVQNKISKYSKCSSEILLHREVLRKLVRQNKKGRPLLIMKYEEYFGNDEKRVRDIASFLNLDIDGEKVSQIVDYVSLDNNLKRSLDIPHDFAIHAFSTWEDPTSGIQGYHVNEKTQGEVGAHQKLFPHEIDLILESSDTEDFGRLRLFAQELGYTY